MRSPSSPARFSRGRASSYAPLSPSAAVLSPEGRRFAGDELQTPPSLTRTRRAASASAQRRRRTTLEADEEENGGAAVASGQAAAAAPSSAGEDAEEECAICLEPLLGGEVYVGPQCGHGFHRACLISCRAANAAQAGRCPLCRAAMPRGLTPAHAREACVKSFQQRRIAGRTGRARDAVRARMLEMQQQRRLDAVVRVAAEAAAGQQARAI